MRIQLLLLLLVGAMVFPASAYPPAPFHRIYGTVRDSRGNPLATGSGTIILSGAGNVEVVRTVSDMKAGPDLNYALSVPMDVGSNSLLYSVSAMRPLLPFTIRVVIKGVSYVPIEMAGATWNVGDPSATTRLDLTLGIDSDGDGLPDQWEYDLINGDTTGRLHSLTDVNPNDDLDGDGQTNLAEYQAGTYALEQSDGLKLEFVELKDGVAHLRFFAIPSRSYSISSSLNLNEYIPQSFSLVATGTNPGMSYRSDDLRTVDVYVPTSGEGKNFYMLHVK